KEARSPCWMSRSTAWRWSLKRSSPIPTLMTPRTISTFTIILIVNSLGSAIAVTAVTCPTWTPRKTTGAPTFRPSTELSKNMTYGTFSVKNFPPPKSNTPATRQTMAPMTKAPITVGLILLPMMSRSPYRVSPGRPTPTSRCGRGVRLPAPEEGPNCRLRRAVPQGLGRAHRQHGLRVGVEEDAVVANGKNARQLVGHDDDCGAEAVP